MAEEPKTAECQIWQGKAVEDMTRDELVAALQTMWLIWRHDRQRLLESRLKLVEK